MNISVIHTKINTNGLIECDIFNINRYISRSFKNTEFEPGRITNEISITIISNINTVITSSQINNIQLSITYQYINILIATNRIIRTIINSNNNTFIRRNNSTSIINIINSERYVYRVVKCNIIYSTWHISTCFRYSKVN